MGRNVNRRDLLAGAAAIVSARRLWGARSHITKSRISAITDEIGRTQADAIAFAKMYGLQWVELRTVPETKQEFAFLSQPELKGYAAQLAGAKLKVSLLKTSLLKFPWPELSVAEGDPAANQKRWERRNDDFGRAIAAAQTLGADKIRIFTGARVAKPETAYPVIARTIEELAPLAETARVRLLIENEPSQNVGTCAELKAILELLPSKAIGFNWDPQNALALKETPWPDGYAQLPKARMLNAQIKAEGLLDRGPANLNWRAVLEGFERDGFQGEVSLATEAGGDFKKADEAMREMMHVVGQL
jgi:sugar phosphate isomerase/epimerase